MNEAIGIIEMFGFVTAITAADAAAKAADVKVIAIDSNKPANAETVEVPLSMAVKVQGSVSAVEAAVDAAQFQRQRALFQICPGVAEGGHAANHGVDILLLVLDRAAPVPPVRRARTRAGICNPCIAAGYSKPGRGRDPQPVQCRQPHLIGALP